MVIRRLTSSAPDVSVPVSVPAPLHETTRLAVATAAMARGTRVQRISILLDTSGPQEFWRPSHMSITNYLITVNPSQYRPISLFLQPFVPEVVVEKFQ